MADDDVHGPAQALQRELKAVEDALRASETRFASAFEYAAIGMAIVGPDGRWLKVNRAVADMLGYTQEELLARTFQELTYPEDLEADLGLVRDLLEGRRDTYQLEKRYIRKDGRIVSALLSVSIVRDTQGQSPYFISQIQDVTERAHAQEELKRTASLLEQIVNSTPDMIFVKDRELRTIICNESFARALGKRPADVIGHTDVENGWDPTLVYGDPARGIRGFATDDRAVLAGQTIRNPHDPANVEGQIRIFDTHKLPLRDASGAVVAVLGVARDITELKREEERRLSLERQVQYAQKLESLGVMAGGVAHDFNNLLTSILGYADLARLESPPGSAARAHLDEVLKGARQAAELTQQMLAYAGKGAFEPTPVSLSAVIADMQRLLEMSVSKRCRITYDCSSELPAIRADKASLRQILMNLAINASDAIGDRAGAIRIATGARYCDKAFLSEAYTDDNLPEGRYVYLRVSDDGCGMSPETRSRIFDPFFTTKFTGRGLGLATVLGIVRAHRGCIKVESEPGRGTTFTVLFAASDAKIDAGVARPAGPSEWRPRGTVLVVDDEDGVRRVAQALLASMGFETLSARDGLEAVEIFAREHERIALVLLDMTMPRLAGAEAFAAMTRIRSGVPTILTSGFNEQVTDGLPGPEGPAGFIQKPYSLDELRGVVRKVLERAVPLTGRQDA